MTIQYGIDHLVSRANLVFGFGWIFETNKKIETLYLQLKLSDGQVIQLQANYGLCREDVETAFVGIANACRSGFFVYGSWSREKQVVQSSLCGKTVNGESFRFDAPLCQLEMASANRPLQGLLISGRIRRAFALIRQLRISELIHKLRFAVKRLPPAEVDDPFSLVSKICEQSGTQRIYLVIDHELGGGANLFREKLIAKRISEGVTVLLLTFHLNTLQYVIEIWSSATRSKRIVLPGLNVISEMARQDLIGDVFFNNAVSFPNPKDIQCLLSQMADKNQIPIHIAIHDYFLVCPSHFLLDSKGIHCAIPDIGICGRCLPKNNYGFCSLAGVEDISEWRSTWANSLESASDITCYSESSATLLLRAYPSLSGKRIHIRPHSIDHLPLTQPQIKADAPLNIGVVGTIGFHKGAQIIADLAKYIKEKQLEIRITVIGSIDAECDPDVVFITGQYSHGNLAKLIERHGANLMFLSSIWPETFSYVTHELIALGLPVACFNFGAPADKVKSYELGCVIQLGSAEEIIKQLIAFYNTLKRRSMPL